MTNERVGTGFRVFPGVRENLDAVPGHSGIEGIDRFLLMTKSSVPGRSFHIAAHYVSGRSGPAADWRFTEPQSHDFDEINLLLPGDGGLRYRYEIDGEIHLVDGPCTVFIPAGATHRMEPAEGAGIFLCVQLNRKRTDD